MASPKIPFTAHSLNPTTFRIIESSPFSKSTDEKPQIYLKFYDELIVIIDTGSVRKPDDASMTLREFIETVPVTENAGQPLNAKKKRDYVVVITHCHFDRIGGVTDFPTSTIGASSAGRKFLAPSTLPTHSLCASVGVSVPLYVPTVFLEDEATFPHVSVEETPLTVLHTPGYTPDSLTLYDPAEGVLFVGGALCGSFPITFSAQTDVGGYLRGLDRLLGFVRSEGRNVEIAAGRGRWDADAEALVGEVKDLVERALRGEVKGIRKGSAGSEVIEYGEGKGVAFSAPERILEEGRKAIGCSTGRILAV